MSEEDILSILMQTAPDLDYRSAIPFARAIEQATLVRADDICEMVEREYDYKGLPQKAYGAWVCKSRIRDAIAEKK